MKQVDEYSLNKYYVVYHKLVNNHSLAAQGGPGELTFSLDKSMYRICSDVLKGSNTNGESEN